MWLIGLMYLLKKHIDEKVGSCILICCRYIHAFESFVCFSLRSSDILETTFLSSAMQAAAGVYGISGYDT